MKKILIVGPDFFGYNDSVKRGFEKLGYETKVYSYFDGYHGLKNKILCSLLGKIGVNYFKRKYDDRINYKILIEVEQYLPNYVLFIKPEKISNKTLEEIKVPKILWMMDSLFRYDKIIDNIKYYDLKYMFEENDVIRLVEMGVKSTFLPLAYDDEVYHPINEIEKDIDILFIGSLYPKRIELLENIINQFPSLNIEIYGKYTNIKQPNTYLKYFFSKYKKYFKNRNVIPREVNQLYARSKICLNMHHSQSNKGCNPRFFEIAANGAFQLVDNNQFIVEKYGEYVEYFSSIEELNQLIRKYIKEEELRISKQKDNQFITMNNSFAERVKVIHQHLQVGGS